MDKKMVRAPKSTLTKVLFIKEFLRMVKKQASSLYQNLLNNIQESWTKVFITDKENSQQKNQFMKAHFKKEKSMGSENKFFLLQD